MSPAIKRIAMTMNGTGCLEIGLSWAWSLLIYIYGGVFMSA
jgi:hypothetical protein